MSNQGDRSDGRWFAPRGSAALSYSTFLGGTRSDVGNDIAVAGDGSVYVTGTPLPLGFGGGQNDAFVVKISPTARACPGRGSL